MTKATSAIGTEVVEIPPVLIGGVTRKMQERSVIASLATAEPQLFADTRHLMFTTEPEAEFVGEGGAKSASAIAIEPVEGKPHKVQVTVRVTDELRWADEDHKLRILEAILDSVAGANARAIDYGMIHAINPLTGEVLESLKAEALAYTSNEVTATGDLQADIDSFPDSVIGDYDVNGIALDRMFANELRKLRNPNTGAKVFPEVNLALDPGSLDGLRAVTSGAVSGKRLAEAPTGIQAIIGDWSMVKWGMVRTMAVEAIEYGDPDGLGDLKRFNQVAYRAEAVFSWANLAPDAFAVLKAPASRARTASKSE